MEDLQGDLEKTLIDTPSKRSGNWTLLFVGDQGRIVRVRNYKALMIIWVSVFVISSAAAATFYYLYQDRAREVTALKQVLSDSRKSAKALRDEKDILMARLVLMESKEKSEPTAPEPKKKAASPLPKPKQAIPPPVKPEPLPPVRTGELPAVEANSDTRQEDAPKPPDVQEPESKSQVAADIAVTEVVAIDDFFALVEQDSNTLRIKYKIRNVNPHSKPVSGRTFIILRGESEDQKDWMIFPEAPLVSGRPAQVQKGRSFSITRFKTIRFKAPYRNGIKPFTQAAILVYTSAGELLIEKSFPIHKEGEASTPNYPQS